MKGGRMKVVEAKYRPDPIDGSPLGEPSALSYSDFQPAGLNPGLIRPAYWDRPGLFNYPWA